MAVPGVGLVACLVGDPAWAQAVGPQTDGAELSLPEVRVRERAASGAPQSVAHNVTVLSARDITRTSATSVADLLATEANLPLQSYFGSGRGATLDMRGMGATAGSNASFRVRDRFLSMLCSNTGHVSNTGVTGAFWSVQGRTG